MTVAPRKSQLATKPMRIGFKTWGRGGKGALKVLSRSKGTARVRRFTAGNYWEEYLFVTPDFTGKVAYGKDVLVFKRGFIVDIK